MSSSIISLEEVSQVTGHLAHLHSEDLFDLSDPVDIVLGDEVDRGSLSP